MKLRNIVNLMESYTVHKGLLNLLLCYSYYRFYFKGEI